MKFVKIVLESMLAIMLFAGCSLENAELPNPEGKVDISDLAGVESTYVRPLRQSSGTFHNSWSTPYELEVDEIICYVAFNNLLHKPTKDPKLNIPDGGNYVDLYAPAQAVENMARQYFDVSVDYLRSCKLYEYEGHPNSYLLPDGYGGGGWNEVIGATQQGNILQIEVGIGGPESDEPTIKGILSIELGDGTFRYLSYKLTQHPNGIS